MAKPKHPPKTPTAKEMLRPSQLRQTQLELMGEDTDIIDLRLALNSKNINITQAITSVNIHRTIEGASSLTVEVVDQDDALLNSGRLSSRNDTEIDGLFFRLVGVAKAGNILTLTFEDREVVLLKSYSKPIKQALSTSRGKITRAEFVLRMVKEVKEVAIPYWIPELHTAQPIDGASKQPPTLYNTKNKGRGIPKVNVLKIKGVKMSEIQRQTANAVLNVGESMLLPRPYLVMAMMAAIQESVIQNLAQPFPGRYNYRSKDPKQNPVGVFQQIKAFGWPATRDISTDATAFFTRLNQYHNGHPGMAYHDLIEGIQGSGNPGAYAQWKTQAERIVDAFGGLSDTAANNNAQWAANIGTQTYEFYRGLPPSGRLNKQKYGGKWGPETSWNCIQRLAQEVQWRAFMVSGTFYFLSEDNLFKSQPMAVINQDTKGIETIDGDYDEGKKSASLTVTCRIGRWQAPPGSIVQVTDMGPWNGRWIVNDVTRNLFDSQGTITLKKPMPRLPEPSTGNVQKTQAAWDLTAFKTDTNQNADGTRPPKGDSIALASKLLTMKDLGKWTDDNGKGLAQIMKASVGLKVGSQNPIGAVYLNPETIRVVLWLIAQGYKIGTYAWCFDHFDDGISGHAGGNAVDISSINGKFINENSDRCRQLTLEVATLLHNATGTIAPVQLICGGYGNKRDAEITALSIPGADLYYGSKTMQDHTNHIHVGFGARQGQDT